MAIRSSDPDLNQETALLGDTASIGVDEEREGTGRGRVEGKRRWTRRLLKRRIRRAAKADLETAQHRVAGYIGVRPVALRLLKRDSLHAAAVFSAIGLLEVEGHGDPEHSRGVGIRGRVLPFANGIGRCLVEEDDGTRRRHAGGRPRRAAVALDGLQPWAFASWRPIRAEHPGATAATLVDTPARCFALIDQCTCRALASVRGHHLDFQVA